MPQQLADVPCLPTSGDDTTLQANVLQVLQRQQLAMYPDPSTWVFQLVSEGEQARILTVRRQDGQAIWQTCPDLVVKLYKPHKLLDLQLVRSQFESLARLHEKLHGTRVNGWQIHVPAPVSQCQRPLALVMTTVPGRSLSSCLEKADQISSEALDCVAAVVVAALEPYWLGASQLHGDLNFDNILCDATDQILSFVDPGVIEDGLLCERVSKRWYPASRDLANLVFETAVSVRRTLRNPGAQQRLEALLEEVLRAFLRKIGPVEERCRLLLEIQECVQAHVRRFQVSWSPRGFWRRLLRRIASRRIDTILTRLRTETLAGSGTSPGAVDP